MTLALASSPAAPSQYLIALCTAAQQSDEPFGVAVKIGSSNSKFNAATSKVIHSILSFSPAPDTMAVGFLSELSKVTRIATLVDPVLIQASLVDCATWAREVMDFLSTKFTKDERSVELKSVVELASHMLSHLLIATRNPGGKKAAQESTHPSPNIHRLREIRVLLDEAITNRSQAALKELLYRRDGFACPFTGLRFAPPGRPVVPRCAHIIPFSFHDKHLRLRALETFAGPQLIATKVIENINHPCNAFNAESNAQESFDKLAWGIEAWKYFFREVRPEEIAGTINLVEGQEIVFHRRSSDGRAIDKPNPQYCNIKLAIARVMHACGAADIMAEMYWDDDDDAIVNQPVYLGGPFVSDDILFRRLDDRLLT